MNVWIVNHYAQLPSLPGGTRHYELGRRLAQKGADVSLIMSTFHHATRAHAAAGAASPSVEMVDGIRLVWIPTRIPYEGNGIARIANMAEFAIRLLTRARSKFRRQLPRPDVVIGSSPHLFAAWSAYCLARRTRAKFVFEVRDLWPETFVALGTFSKRHPVVLVLRVLERFLYRRADAIVSLLPEARRYVEETVGVEDKVTWISNGAAVTPQDPVLRALAPGEPLTVMYVGAHGIANVLDVLLSAAHVALQEGLPLRFVLVGDGPERPRLMEKASELGLSNIEFRAAVPKHAVQAALQEADVLVALLEDTSLYQYGISLNKLFDYMVAGKPIALAGRAAHNYVEIAQCGRTVPPRDPEALARTLADLAAMTVEGRREMGARGRAYVKAYHSWDVLAERLAAVLDDVVTGVQRQVK
jgi:glycosyltransferase involved in cell wall biosynthesis